MSDNKIYNVIAFGEVLWDLLPDQSIIGGAPFNFTYRINSLGYNGLMISRVGDDQLGRLALEKINDLGILPDYIQNDPRYPTGTVEVFFDDQKNPDYTIIRDVAYDYIEFTPALAELCKSADCFYFGTLAQRNQRSRDSLYKLFDIQNNTTCFYDVNLRKDCYSKSNIKDSLARADIVKLNDSEALELKDILSIASSDPVSIGKNISDTFSIEVCLITMGEKGALALSQSGEICYVPGYRVKLADPLGAGDAFSAGFIHAWLYKKDLHEACELGNIMGAIVATQEGATVPIQQKSIDSFNINNPHRNTDETFKEFINR